ncbi:uncharacterized protein LOC132716739 [Ruditapes philippinarum]|uniref:uncharacterized protein LOC132716739 n=1 Tax=Ruditapes philippinarum TaxID=129788 RepID=UPI00295B91AE|nr:uncharacterized protein LOC132716739 [Ruditapes philippinarum]
MLVLLLISFLAVTQCLTSEVESTCSRYHYEEQLLEKMIRMEIKVEDIEKRISKTNQNVIDVLEDMKTERTNIKNDNKELKALLLTDTIAFKARGPTDLSLATGQTIIFAKNMLNKGEAYNNNTGIFTAPMSGTYIFMIHLCIASKKYMNYGIMVEDTVYTSGTFFDNDSITCYTAAALVVLNGGERVYVKCLLASSSGNVLYESTSSTNNFWNTFSGLLVHR